MPELLTVDEAGKRQVNAKRMVAAGWSLVALGVCDDLAKLPNLHALFTMHTFFGLLSHAIAAAAIHVGAKRMDP